jgi:HPt (histidine-containing phosphotransfer) domain-containing protein
VDDLNLSAETPDAQTKPVDLDVLFATFGQQLIADLLADYVLEADERMLQLSDAIGRRDIDAVNQYVHDLKGSSATIYATELTQLSTSMEAYARGNQFTWENMKERLDAIEKAWKVTRQYLAEKGYCEQL